MKGEISFVFVAITSLLIFLLIIFGSIILIGSLEQTVNNDRYNSIEVFCNNQGYEISKTQFGFRHESCHKVSGDKLIEKPVRIFNGQPYWSEQG